MLTKDQFKRYMTELLRQYKSDNEMTQALSVLSPGTHVMFEAGAATVALRELIKELMLDYCEWVDYWLFDLEQGKKYEAGCITDGKGNNIKLKTMNDLYKLLVKEYKINEKAAVSR